MQIFNLYINFATTLEYGSPIAKCIYGCQKWTISIDLSTAKLCFWENPLAFSDKLVRTLHLSLEVDLPAVEFIEYHHILKLKQSRKSRF